MIIVLIEIQFRVRQFGLLLGWVDFVLVVALSAWKGGNLGEMAE